MPVYQAHDLVVKIVFDAKDEQVLFVWLTATLDVTGNTGRSGNSHQYATNYSCNIFDAIKHFVILFGVFLAFQLRTQ